MPPARARGKTPHLPGAGSEWGPQQNTPPLPGARPVPAPANPHPESLFTPSENCVACHNVLTTPSGTTYTGSELSAMLTEATFERPEIIPLLPTPLTLVLAQAA